ncbi:MAG: hypothetical protein IJ867_04530 [Clostridia bacterium]|nr:hypothetical protein [Clostridia bacterium]
MEQSSEEVIEYDAFQTVLDELTGDIEDSLNEAEKFRKIYERVALYLVYDYASISPSLKSEEELASLAKSALLKGKADCLGYASSLKEACGKKGLECEIVQGPVDRIKSKKSYPYRKKENKASIIFSDEKSVIVRAFHAWNKVKIDGVWYNCDITWDRKDIVNHKAPKYALLSDELYKKLGRPTVESADKPCTKNIVGAEKNKFFAGLAPCDSLVANNVLMEFESTMDENGELRQLPAVSKSFPWAKLLYNLKKLAKISKGKAVDLYYNVKYKINPEAEINDRPTEEFRIITKDKIGE